MMNAVGNAHWFRCLLLEILGQTMSRQSWEGQLTSIPYVAVTDSKSLYDCLHKLVCAYTQTEDKRTAIDTAILKDDMQRTGGRARWIEGTNMILCDPLAKKMKGCFLRQVADSGRWTLNKEFIIDRETNSIYFLFKFLVEAPQSVAGVNFCIDRMARQPFTQRRST